MDITISFVYNSGSVANIKFISEVFLDEPEVVIYVFNNSGNDMPALAARNITVIDIPNRGFGASHNVIFTQAHEPRYLLILNPDCTIEPEALRILLDHLIANPKSAVASCKIIGEKNWRESLAFSAMIQDSIKRKIRPTVSNLDPPQRVEAISGALMLWRYEIFKRIGGFDERYFMYYEDMDLCRRVRKLGFDIVMSKQATAVHEGQYQSHRDLRLFTCHCRSFVRFFIK